MNKLEERFDQAYKVLVSTHKYNQAVFEMIESGLTKELVQQVKDMIFLGIKNAGGKGFSPKNQMDLMELSSEFDWLFYDEDDYVDENFMNDTADEIPTIFTLICYYLITISILNR
jgi:hypothetical protein